MPVCLPGGGGAGTAVYVKGDSKRFPGAVFQGVVTGAVGSLGHNPIRELAGQIKAFGPDDRILYRREGPPCGEDAAYGQPAPCADGNLLSAEDGQANSGL